MRSAFLLLLALSTHAATLTVDPPVIYDCTGTFGKATVRWQGASGPVQVLVGPSKVVFTGFGDTSGATETGVWVGDGLEFRLVNQQGEVEALTVARVVCDGALTPGNGLVSESYFPLNVGNTWIFKTNSRTFTADYVIWKVTGLRRIQDRWYSQIDVTTPAYSSFLGYFREEAGLIIRLTDTPSGTRDEVYLNPRGVQHGSFRNTLGSFPDAAFQTRQQDALVREEQVFVRGVGLARSTTALLTGSSGGFTGSLELVDFQLASGLRVETPAMPRISLSIAKTFLDITGKQLENCAIPCYYAACGIGSPVDPPGTYKPCVQIRIEAAVEGELQMELSLKNREGVEIAHHFLLTASGEATRYLQLPLYGESNKLFAAGAYVLTAKLKRRQEEVGSASMAVEIR